MERMYDDDRLQYCYEMGIDSINNGANVANSHFSIFSSERTKDAWEQGRKVASSNKRINA